MSRPHACPICSHTSSSPLSTAFPFCGERCKLIDLGRWLDGEYTLPAHLDRHDKRGDEDDD